MKMRIVIELDYPSAITEFDEAEVKETLSSAMLKLAREEGFTVQRPGHSPFKAEEVMVGCAQIGDVLPSKLPPV